MIKILYAGSPQAARLTLESLIKAQSTCGFEITGVLSNPPSAKGRHKDLIPTPVAQFAEEQNLPVFTPEHLDSAARDVIRPLGADILVCFAYGHIFGPKFLELFPLGGINLHPSLLPKYRGCTPVPAAILNRDKETAVTIQSLSLKMDEGNILAQSLVNLNGKETGESLLNYCAEEGASLISSLLSQTSKNGRLPEGHPQKGQASYTGIIKKEDGKINWSESSEVIEAKIRAYYPLPGCWCLENGLTLRILEAALFAGQCENQPETALPGTVLAFSKSDGILIKTGDGILAVKKLQRQGKNAMDYKSFMNGSRNFLGTVLE